MYADIFTNKTEACMLLHVTNLGRIGFNTPTKSNAELVNNKEMIVIEPE